MEANLQRLEGVAPNFKKRMSGVSASVVGLVPLQAKMGFPIAALGPALPSFVPRIRACSIFGLRTPPVGNTHRVWHARRNIEMVTGLVLRDVFGFPLKLVFTAAGERRRSAFTHWLLSKVDHIVAVTPRCAEYIHRPCTIIMHGIDTQRFRPPPSSTRESREHFWEKLKVSGCLPKSAPIPEHLVGCFGRIRPTKGTDLFIDTMLALLPHYPQWSALIIGKVTKKYQKFAQTLREKIKRAGLSSRILFVEEQRDMPLCYQALSLYVCPSLSEGFGLTPLEALACAVPVVATNVGAAASFVTSTTGYLVKKNDLVSLEKGIETFFKNPGLGKQCGQAGRILVEKEFSIEKEAAALIKVYRALLQQIRHASDTF